MRTIYEGGACTYYLPSTFQQASLDQRRESVFSARQALLGQRSELPLLGIGEQRDDLQALYAHAEKISSFDEVVFLGTGGSGLGGRMLVRFARGDLPYEGPKLTFIDNVDAQSFAAHLASDALTRRHYVAVSKSGSTPETLTQAMLVVDALRRAGCQDLSRRLSGITEPEAGGKTNGLRALMRSLEAPVLDHPPAIGGRYSCLSVVGLLPAHLAGLDVVALRNGAGKAVRSLFGARELVDSPALIGAGFLDYLSKEQCLCETVLMTYGDRFDALGAWFEQLWAESLGKDGKGTAPLAARGPVDQHSKLQLFLGGPANKVYTLVACDDSGAGARIPRSLATLVEAPMLAGRTVGDLVFAEFRATRDALVERGRPLRTIMPSSCDSEGMGYLLMHLMLETILSGFLMGVDPFDQPAVEAIKVGTRNYLLESDA